MSLILFWSLRVDDFSIGKWEKSSSLAESNKDVGLSNKVVEPLHKILGDKISPSLLVIWILHDWSQDLIAHGMHMLEDIFGDLDKDDIIFEVLLLQLISSNSQDDKALSFVLVDRWSLGGQGDLVSARGERIDDLVEVILAEKAVECILVGLVDDLAHLLLPRLGLHSESQRQP